MEGRNEGEKYDGWLICYANAIAAERGVGSC